MDFSLILLWFGGITWIGLSKWYTNLCIRIWSYFKSLMWEFEADMEWMQEQLDKKD